MGTIGGGLAFVFVAVALILLRVLPGPLKPVDYLVIGSISTFLCLMAILGAFLVIDPGARASFFGKQKR